MTVQTRLRVGTRRSRLAGVQAALFMEALRAAGRRVDADLVEVRTHGDALSARHPRGGFEATDGQFTAELERAVVSGRIDVAVHSFKDLPTLASPDAVVAAVLPRADARDCLLTSTGAGLRGLPDGASVGTGSLRRTFQLQAARPDVTCRPIRGNVETRVERMRRGEYDAVVLACAGIDRLQVPIPDDARLSFDVMLPAPAQGALAIQIHRDRTDLIDELALLDHAPTRTAVDAERALLRAIGGGCLAPLGVLGEVGRGQLRLRAAYLPDGARELVSADIRDAIHRADRVVEEAARQLRNGSPR